MTNSEPIVISSDEQNHKSKQKQKARSRRSNDSDPSDSDPSDSDSIQEPLSIHYLKKEDMPDDLREALRVCRSFILLLESILI
jgi:hypothetical protein